MIFNCLLISIRAFQSHKYETNVLGRDPICELPVVKIVVEVTITRREFQFFKHFNIIHDIQRIEYIKS